MSALWFCIGEIVSFLRMGTLYTCSDFRNCATNSAFVEEELSLIHWQPPSKSLLLSVIQSVRGIFILQVFRRSLLYFQILFHPQWDCVMRDWLMLWCTGAWQHTLRWIHPGSVYPQVHMMWVLRNLGNVEKCFLPPACYNVLFSVFVVLSVWTNQFFFVPSDVFVQNFY